MLNKTIIEFVIPGNNEEEGSVMMDSVARIQDDTNTHGFQKQAKITSKFGKVACYDLSGRTWQYCRHYISL